MDKNEHNVKKLLIFTMLVPFAPDDIVCLVAGITDISLKEFMKIVLLLKFWSVATYSYLMLYLFQLFGNYNKRQQNQRWFCCLFSLD